MKSARDQPTANVAFSLLVGMTMTNKLKSREPRDDITKINKQENPFLAYRSFGPISNWDQSASVVCPSVVNRQCALLFGYMTTIVWGVIHGLSNGDLGFDLE